MKYLCILLLLILILGFASCEKDSLKKRTTTYKQVENFSLLFLGDIHLDIYAEDFIKKKGINYPFNKMKKYFSKYNYVVGNLEFPISNRGKAVKDKKYTFRVAPQYAKSVKEAGIKVVSLANNHVLDYGPKSFIDTIKYLKKWKILYTGAGKNLTEARKPAIVYYKNRQIVILGYSQITSRFFARINKMGTAPFIMKYVLEDIKKYKTKKNVVILSLHWGNEYHDYPQKYQRKLAYKMLDSGADAIIGHHPHILQGIETYKGKPIFYSLGNFIFGYYNPKYRDNIITGLHFNKNKLSAVEVFSVAGNNSETHFQPFVINNKRGMKNLKKVVKLSKKFKTQFIFTKNSLLLKLK